MQFLVMGESGVHRVQIQIEPSSFLYANELKNAMNQVPGVGVRREENKGVRDDRELLLIN